MIDEAEFGNESQPDIPRSTSMDGYSSVVDYGEGIRLPSFAAIPSPMQYETVIESSRQIARVDFESDAYDRFLFGGDGITGDGNYEFPAEAVFRDRLALESSRIQALGKKDLIKGLVQRLSLQRELVVAEGQAELLRSKLALNDREREYHGQKLDGKSPDADGVSWIGVRRDPENWWSARWALYSSLVTMLFVAAVDMLVLMMSLAAFIGNDFEGIAFAIPALGIQVFFPHLIGERLARIVRGSTKKVFDYSAVVFFGVLWIAFAALIAMVRFRYLESTGQAQIRKLFGADKLAATIELKTNLPLAMPITFLVILGLGLWLIFTGYKVNPHELAYLRLGLKSEKNQNALSKALVEVNTSRSRVALQEKGIQMLEQNIEEHARLVAEEFPRLAIDSYRRYLVNAFQEPDFTTAVTKGVPSDAQL